MPKVCGGTSVHLGRDDRVRALAALQFVDPACDRQTWFKVAAALADAGCDVDDFVEWSRQAPNFKNEADCRTAWRGASRPGPVTAATLFQMAQAAGWRDDGSAPLVDPAEQQRRRAEREAAAVREAAETKARQEAVAIECQRLYRNAVRNPASHPYQVKKLISLGPNIRRGEWPQRSWRDALLVPYFDLTGKLWSIQAISIDGRKDWPKDARAKGLFYPHGLLRNAPGIVVAEGAATLAVCSAATGLPGMAAGAHHNLMDVARAARALARKGAPILLCADDNASHPQRNVGLEDATAAAQAVDGLVVHPGLTDADFWDLFAAGGLAAVRERFAEEGVCHE